LVLFSFKGGLFFIAMGLTFFGVIGVLFGIRAVFTGGYCLVWGVFWDKKYSFGTKLAQTWHEKRV
jgi:hypothetical protein